jgi:hypothetical protein
VIKTVSLQGIIELVGVAVNRTVSLQGIIELVGVAVNRNYDSISATAPSKSAAAGRVDRFTPTFLFQ